MLALTRRPGQEIVIDGPATIRVVRCQNGRVRLGIKADDGVKILRGELVGMPTEKEDGKHLAGQIGT